MGSCCSQPRIRVDFTEKLTSEQRFEGGETSEPPSYLGKEGSYRGAAKAKAGL